MFGLDVRAAVLTRFVARKENHSSRLLCVAFKHEVAPGDSPKAFVPSCPIPSVWLIGSASQLLPTLSAYPSRGATKRASYSNCQVSICLKSAIFPRLHGSSANFSAALNQFL